MVAAFTAAPPASAQSGEAVLTTVRDVLALPDDVAESEARAAKLRGVVIYVTASRDEFALHDGKTSVSVLVPDAASAPELAAEVEIEGTVFSEPLFERKQTRVKLSKITVLGTGTLPEPVAVNIEDVVQFKHLDQWVSIEGTVLQVRSSMSLFTIQMVEGTASCNVLVRDWPRASVPRDWIGGRVRVSGLNRVYMPGSRFLTLVAPSPAQVTVLKTGVTDPLDAPLTTVGTLHKSGPSKERVKLTGTLVGATTGNVYYARGEDGSGFSFYMLHPIDEDKSGRLSTPIIIPKVQPGDALEVVGIPARVEPGVHLDFGVVRVVRSNAEPVAAQTDIATIVGGTHVHDVVEVQGRLVSIDDVLVAPGRYRTTMQLADGKSKIIAYLDAPERGALRHLEVDHLLRVRGIVTGAPHFPEIRLWVPTTGDLQSQGVAEEIETRKLWTGLGIAAVAVVILAGWVLMLGRSRAAVRVANATLEARVAERTAELAAAKEDLARALSQERELSELKTRFVSIVSHEFRTPLGITMSAVEVLRHYGGQITEDKRGELHDDIFSATVQMSALMEQVLLLGRAEAGKLECRCAPIDLPAHCIQLTEDAVQATNQHCPVTFTAEGDFSDATMDAALLRHIIGNLLSNAVKYSPADAHVDFKLRRDGSEVVITVEDRGIGIPEADQARLFEAFHRASNVGETPGTGLGLLLVKRCVDLQHGSISVQSLESQGTTFTVRLPMRA